MSVLSSISRIPGDIARRAPPGSIGTGTGKSVYNRPASQSCSSGPRRSSRARREGSVEAVYACSRAPFHRHHPGCVPRRPLVRVGRGRPRSRTPAPPAHIAFAEGSASLDREGQAQPVTAGLPFLVGDRLRTTGGRVEVLFPDGSALDIDEYSSVDLLSPTLLRVSGGRIMLIVAGAEDPAGALRYQVDTPVASASTDGPGEYRIALLSGPAGLEAELAVLRGLASLRTERGSTPVRAGERSLARDLEAPSIPALPSIPRGSTRSIGGRLYDATPERVPRSRRDISRASCRCTAAPSTVMARGSTNRSTGTCGIPPPLPIGGRTTTATGRRTVRTDGHGLASTSGDGRRITMAAGASRTAAGSGFRSAGGRLRG